jgi:hypothetical protein
MVQKLGKWGKINKNANSRLKALFRSRGVTTCELRFAGCMHDNFLSFAHRHKRLDYRRYPKMLSDYNQVILACAPCHRKIEYDKALTKEVFERLRGSDNMPV